MTETAHEHGPCSRCAWYRPVRPRSEILGAIAQASTQGPELAQAISKIVDDEQKLRDAEAETKGKEAVDERDKWPTRPLMTDYCGLQENDEIYLIAEVRNSGLRCNDFRDAKTQPLARHACSDCASRVAAKGPERDRQSEESYTQMIGESIAVQAKSASEDAQAGLKDFRSGMSARKSLEIGRAYSSNGVLLREPDYLDWCASFSTQDDYVLCALKNPYNSCPAWTAIVAQPAAAPQEVPPMMESPLLSPGPPPLTREASDRAIDLIDYMAAAVRGVDLIEPTPQMRDSFASYLATYYPMLDPQSRLFFASAPESLAQVQAVFPTLPEPNRAMCLQYWAQQLNAIFQFAGALLQPAPPQFMPGAPVYPGAQQPMPVQPAAAAYAPPVAAPPDTSVAGYLNTMIAEGDKKEQAAAARSAGEAAQVKANNDLVYSTMLSNIANMQHQAMMTVANNFRA